MELDHAELQEMLANDPYMLLVDVRDEEEFDAGHIPYKDSGRALPVGTGPGWCFLPELL